MSKKLALGASTLILDVKWGSGAFRDTVASALELGLALREVARGVGMSAQAVVTDMNQPLGPAVGNACEIRAATDVLSGSPGLRALIDVLGHDSSSLFAEDISFRIGPRLNAAGRMGHASLAVQLLCATSYGEARKLARELESLNRARQKIEQKIVAEALELVEADPANASRRVLLVVPATGFVRPHAPGRDVDAGDGRAPVVEDAPRDATHRL